MVVNTASELGTRHVSLVSRGRCEAASAFLLDSLPYANLKYRQWPPL
jgi:hypothetical protein